MMILASNPFFAAYGQSDAFGKLIFFSLFALSILSWVVIAYKLWMTRCMKRSAGQFRTQFHRQKKNPLGMHAVKNERKEFANPYAEIYSDLKSQTVDILNKNSHFSSSEDSAVCLSAADLSLVESHSALSIAEQTSQLERHLFVLPTTTRLAPFLGLLGTVWGILITFSELQVQSTASANQMVLGGLSMALATTVLGLVVAIPALIGDSYLRTVINTFNDEMENFSQEVINAIEMQYRKVDVHS